MCTENRKITLAGKEEKYAKSNLNNSDGKEEKYAKSNFNNLE